MRLVDLPIPNSLLPWLERLSWVELMPHEHLPLLAGARVHLLFLVEGAVRVRIGELESSVDGAVSFGPIRGAGAVSCDARACAWLVKLAGGVAPAVIGCSAEALAGWMQPLERLWPHLCAERLADEADHGLTKVLESIETAIGRWEDRLVWSPRQCARVMGFINAMPIARLPDQLGISKATLERRVWASFGLAPKSLARVQRLYASLGMIDAASDADLALRAGFFDQSHFIADFRQLTGTTPTQFRRMATPRPDLLSLYNAATLAGMSQGG
ncbi:hypothetical protein GCM10025771_32460 [Niveibacterium umoris]|uniref:AraC-like DNA-binding protein n=1 Tax=Niveibacterium umoris TaxID=1193620 RepID=A0A840BIZ6_9RHOO|nr:helix-turn-helix domain-containing protein [Niveibacterium umoris]MBB4011559.1 AraC-like DNA-binding protein [Niveibacterium umoris]